MRNDAPVSVHCCNNQVGRLALVETVFPLIDDTRERSCEVGLHPAFSGLMGRTVCVVENTVRGWELHELLPTHRAIEDPAFSRQFDSRPDHLHSTFGAVFLEREESTGHRSGHSRGQSAASGQLLDEVTVVIQEHVGVGACRCLLAIVDASAHAIGCSDQHESAAPHVSRRGVYDGQSLGSGNGGIATLLENLDTNP